MAKRFNPSFNLKLAANFDHIIDIDSKTVDDIGIVERLTRLKELEYFRSSLIPADSAQPNAAILGRGEPLHLPGKGSHAAL